MRSKKKSPVSKPRLLRAFQGPPDEESRHFQALHPMFAVSISVRNDTL
jgi:hypothetical protein